VSEALQQEIRHLHTLEGSPLDPDGRIFLPLADAHIRAGELDEAERLLVDGLERHPDFVAAHVLAARLREAQGNVDGAELAWAAARRLDPENVEVLFGLGRIMASRGEEIGVALVEKARSLDPTAGSGVPPISPGPATSDASEETSEPTGTSEAAAEAPEEDGAGVVSIADLAPEPVRADDADIVSIADLAPDPAPGIGDPAPITDFAPEAASLDTEDEAALVSIADLAPERVVERGEEPKESQARGEASALEPVPPSRRDVSANGERRVVTRTLAELLVTQGQHSEALETYEMLVARNPDDVELRARLEELRAAGPLDPQTPPEPGEDDDLDYHPSAPPPAPDAPTPFAWTETGDRDAEAEELGGPGVAGYFEDLLSWTPSPPPDEDV